MGRKVTRAQQNPAEWLRHAFDARPWDAQKKILTSIRDHKRTAVRSAHGCGKSWIAAHAALWFLYTRRNSIVFTTAPTFRQVESILWEEIRSAHRRAIRPLGGRVLQTALRLGEKWMAFGLSADNADGFQGLHAESILGIVDEAAGVNEQIWTGVDANLSAGFSRLLMIGNPTSIGTHFHQEFDPLKRPNTSRLVISAFDTPNFTTFGITLDDIRAGTWTKKITGPLPAPHLVSPEWVADSLRKWGEASPFFRSRVLAEFPDAGDDSLIPMHLVEAAQRRWLEYVAPAKASVNRLSCDIARYGTNATVIGHRRDVRFSVHEALRGSSITEGAGKIVLAHVKLGTTEIVVDGDGLGGGTIDILTEQGRPVVEFRGSGVPANKEDERFVNARAEAYWTLREAFFRGEPVIDPNDDDLAGQLAAIKFKVTSKGKIQIESKDEMAARGLPSPDHADSMAMAWAPSNKAAAGFLFAMRAVINQGGVR